MDFSLEVAMRPETEISQPASQEPAATIDYDYFRAVAVIERRKAIAAFPGQVRLWMKPVFQRLFSTFRLFRANPARWLSTSKSAD